MASEKYTGINRLFHSWTLQKILDKINDGTIRTVIDDWKWIFTFTKRYKPFVIFYTILGILSSTLSLGASWVSAKMIDIITNHQADKLWLLITIMVGSTLFSLAFSSIMSRVSTKISIYVNNDIQSLIFDKIIDARWTELNKYQNGDLLNRFNSDVGTIAGNAISWIPNLIIDVYIFTLTFIIMVRMDWVMAIIALLAAPFLLISSKFIMRKMRMYRQKVLELNSDMMSFEVETFFNFDTIKSFGIIGYYGRQLKEWQKKYKKHNLEYNKFEINANIWMTILSTLVAMTAFGYCLWRLWNNFITYGTMTFFLEQRGALTSRFNALVKIIPGMMNSSVSAHRVRELVELDKEVHDPESYEKLSAIADDGISVELKDVSFSYKEDSEIYKDCSFTAHPGEIVAVLGSSGEGKTTLLRMILGLILPDTGAVTLTGSDGVPVPVNADLRQLFSYVPQGNTVFSGTIAENMRMVKEDATDEELIEALKTACAWEFIEKLPDGIYSRLGDNGRGLSMGQGQRISIARSLLRDSPILLLDEATSALDVGTERRVLQNIIHQRPNKTCIVSTHRPSVLEQCQRIYRVEGKRITELNETEAEEAVRRYMGQA